MFESKAAGSNVRLIDFGCSTNKVVEGLHTTFAGTPFYNSPEMFQKTYRNKTDVWSVSVLLYVLQAFNKLTDRKRKTTKILPNMRQDMPDSYYEFLDKLLTYHHKQRKTSGEVLKLDFVVFHKDLQEEEQDGFAEALAKPSLQKSRMMSTPSIAVLGSVQRHSAFLDFKKFERSLTTCLTRILPHEDVGYK
jgi:serine/threonine protein kinase